MGIEKNTNSREKHNLSRRSFLKFGAAGVGAVALASGGGVLGLFALRGSAPAVAGLEVLSAHEYRTISTIAQVHLPEAGEFSLSAKDFDIGSMFDIFLNGEPEENVSQIKQALLLFEYGPVVFDRKLATFSNLSPEMQLAHWNAWINSDSVTRRQVAMILRKFMSLVFFDQPEVWPHILYPVPAFSGVEQT